MFVEILNDYDPALFLVKPGNEVIGTTMLSTRSSRAWSARWPRSRWCRSLVTAIVLAVGTRVLKIGVTGGHDA